MSELENFIESVRQVTPPQDSLARVERAVMQQVIPQPRQQYLRWGLRAAVVTAAMFLLLYWVPRQLGGDNAMIELPNSQPHYFESEIITGNHTAILFVATPEGTGGSR